MIATPAEAEREKLLYSKLNGELKWVRMSSGECWMSEEIWISVVGEM